MRKDAVNEEGGEKMASLKDDIKPRLSIKKTWWITAMLVSPMGNKKLGFAVEVDTIVDAEAKGKEIAQALDPGYDVIAIEEVIR